MVRRPRIDNMLNDNVCVPVDSVVKGMCQRCGHYTRISISSIKGIRVCRDCDKELRREMQKDFL